MRLRPTEKSTVARARTPGRRLTSRSVPLAWLDAERQAKTARGPAFREAGCRWLDGSYARAVRAERDTGGVQRIPEPVSHDRAEAGGALGGFRPELCAERLGGAHLDPRRGAGGISGSNEKLDRIRGQVRRDRARDRSGRAFPGNTRGSAAERGLQRDR